MRQLNPSPFRHANRMPCNRMPPPNRTECKMKMMKRSQLIQRQRTHRLGAAQSPFRQVLRFASGRVTRRPRTPNVIGENPSRA